jgi:serine/threonine-protein kinase
MLDENDHQNLNPAGADKPLVLDFRDGAWESRPDKVTFDCLGPQGAPAKQTTTQTIRLEQLHGALRGTMTVKVNSDECSQQGATIEIPAVATHVGEVPAGVEVPSAPTIAPPEPARPTPTR